MCVLPETQLAARLPCLCCTRSFGRSALPLAWASSCTWLLEHPLEDTLSLVCSPPLHFLLSPSPRLPETLLRLHSPREGQLPQTVTPVPGSGSSLQAAEGPSVWASSSSSQALRVAVLRFSIPNDHLHRASEGAPLRMCPSHPRPHLGNGVAKQSAWSRQQRQLKVMAPSEGRC